jgi:hypothetical protein
VRPLPTWTRAMRGPRLARTPRDDARIRTPGASLIEKPTNLSIGSGAQSGSSPDRLCCTDSYLVLIYICMVGSNPGPRSGAKRPSNSRLSAAAAAMRVSGIPEAVTPERVWPSCSQGQELLLDHHCNVGTTAYSSAADRASPSVTGIVEAAPARAESARDLVRI